jgi:hypothetical protein
MLAYRKISCLNDEEVKSNISMSSFGTVLKQSLLSKGDNFKAESILEDLNLKNLGSIDLREFSKKNAEEPTPKLLRSVSDLQIFKSINANLEAELNASGSKISKFQTPNSLKMKTKF